MKGTKNIRMGRRKHYYYYFNYFIWGGTGHIDQSWRKWNELYLNWGEPYFTFFRNVENFRNVMTDIMCHTLSEPQPWADLNDNENVHNNRNVENVRIDIKCHTFLQPQAPVWFEWWWECFDRGGEHFFQMGGNATFQPGLGDTWFSQWYRYYYP